MDDTYAREADQDEPVTEWDVHDPRWRAYMRGWRAGYGAAERDLAERMPAHVADALAVERFAAVLKDLRDRESGSGIF